MRSVPTSVALIAYLSVGSIGCSDLKAQRGEEPEQQEEHETQHPIILTSPVAKDVDIAQRYVCQIHANRYIELRALERGYLQEIKVQEGQAVKKGQLLFKLLPVVYNAKLHADEAELQRADIALRNTEMLSSKNVVSNQELAMAKAERERAKARVELASAELSFTDITAPFDGIIDRQYQQQGSLVDDGDMVTTISDNSVMWVYFNVPEADYLAFQAAAGAREVNRRHQLKLADSRIELQLANGKFFDHPADEIVTVESSFDNETGNILFRVDFPNPEHLLRHGQTGTLWIHQPLKNALVIPQRATFEILDKRYVYVVDEQGVAHQRAIGVAHEMDDIFVVNSGLALTDKIVLEGARQTRDGEHVEGTFRKPEEVLASMKKHAE
ncbi:MAG TPA: efflux RND transporter periplasmic adaptor subunit [Polyangiales bacterium]|nr:efflux RND transporter periplasmic adaptor subunit [Polyangiales bacterium]